MRYSRPRGANYSSPQNKGSRDYFFKTDTRSTTLHRNQHTAQLNPILDISPVIKVESKLNVEVVQSGMMCSQQDMSCVDNDPDSEIPSSKP
jgi:hypothetical protein